MKAIEIRTYPVDCVITSDPDFTPGPDGARFYRAEDVDRLVEAAREYYSAGIRHEIRPSHETAERLLRARGFFGAALKALED